MRESLEGVAFGTPYELTNELTNEDPSKTGSRSRVRNAHEQTAACAGIATATFDPWFSSDPDEQEWAKARCARCPIGEACLAGALERGERAGIWFGVDLGAVDMAEPVAWVRPQVFAPQHGSRAAYMRCRDGEGGKACADCRAGNARWMADWRERRAFTPPPVVEPQPEQMDLLALVTTADGITA